MYVDLRPDNVRTVWLWPHDSTPDEQADGWVMAELRAYRTRDGGWQGWAWWYTGIGSQRSDWVPAERIRRGAWTDE